MGSGAASVPGRALVTGAAGFAGQWLCRDLVRHGWSVTGAGLTGDPGPGILTPEEHAAVAWHGADLRDSGRIGAFLDEARPDAVFHLAGVAHVSAAGRDPVHAFDVNTGIAVRLLYAVAERRAAGTLDPVVLVVGSGEQYGSHADAELPLGEEAECRPASLYGASKLAQETFARQLFRSDGVRAVCTRSFNHSGRGQTPQFFIPALVSRALSAKAAHARSVEVGNTESVRDFLHVEDAVRAYVLLVERGTPGEVYNVCSGHGVRVGDLAAEIMRAAGITATLTSTPALRRPSDVPALVGRNDKLRAHTGWAASRPRADIIADLVHAASH